MQITEALFKKCEIRKEKVNFNMYFIKLFLKLYCPKGSVLKYPGHNLRLSSFGF